MVCFGTCLFVGVIAWCLWCLGFVTPRTALASNGRDKVAVKLSPVNPANPTDAANPMDEEVLRACGIGDSVLHQTARAMVQRTFKGSWTDLEVEQHLEHSAYPYPHARTWSLRAKRVDRVYAKERLARWVASLPQATQRRCGIASVRDSVRGEAVVVVTVPVLAHFTSDLPKAMTRSGWVGVRARVVAPCTGARVVVLGPWGGPHTVPASFDRDNQTIVSGFTADRPGYWWVQILADLANGPEPVLQGQVRVGQQESRKALAAVPGLLAGKGLADDEAIYAKLNEARANHGVGHVTRLPQLDALARQHTEEMISRKLLAHDVGRGTPAHRVGQSGITASEVGENIAKAATPELAHKALWKSLSHRQNMLHSRYRHVGIAARKDASGTLWLTQIFTSTLQPL